MSTIAFLFPGQGAQYVGMAKNLVETLPAAQKLFEQSQAILGYDLLKICLAGDQELLDRTEISQPAIFVSSLAALESLKQAKPDVFESCRGTAGLSLGEYTALVFAGALSFSDGLRLVDHRGKSMQKAADNNPGSMVSLLGLDLSTAKEFVDQINKEHFLQIANYLCPGNTVVSGSLAGCEKIEKMVAERGGKTVRLAVAGAFHTPYMQPADTQLAEMLAMVPMQTPRIPIWSNVDAKAHTDVNEIRTLLVSQVVKPVLMEPLLRDMMSHGMDSFYEIGPGRVLVGLLKRIQRNGNYFNFGT